MHDLLEFFNQSYLEQSPEGYYSSLVIHLSWFFICCLWSGWRQNLFLVSISPTILLMPCKLLLLFHSLLSAKYRKIWGSLWNQSISEFLRSLVLYLRWSWDREKELPWRKFPIISTKCFHFYCTPATLMYTSSRIIDSASRKRKQKSNFQ